MSSPTSLDAQSPETVQGTDPFLKDNSERPVDHNRDNTALPIANEKGEEMYARECRVVEDGSESDNPHVTLCAWDGKNNLPGGGATMYYYGYTEFEDQQLKHLKPWINPDPENPENGLGDTVEMTFTRPKGSSGQYSTCMTDRGPTKKNKTPVNETPAEGTPVEE